MAKKWWIIGFTVLAVSCAGLVLFGVLTHKEPGLMRTNVMWSKKEFPLVVKAVPYASSEDAHKDTRDTTLAAIKTTNERLGFTAFKYDMHAEKAHVTITVGVPQDSNLKAAADFSGATIKDPGGAFLLSTNSYGKYWVDCLVQTSNTGSSSMLYMVLQHELAHCLGLDHDDYKASIMYPKQTEWNGGFAPRISDYDRELLRDAYAP